MGLLTHNKFFPRDGRMNNLFEKGVLTNLDSGTCFAYVLSDNSLFLPTDYKVLLSQENGCFVKCMKMLFNGKVMFYYNPGNAKTLESLFKQTEIGNLRRIIAGLLMSVIEVKNNGFLTCQNVDASFDKIFVDQSGNKVLLVYMPVAQKNFQDYFEFENALRSGLIKRISEYENLSGDQADKLNELLSDAKLSIEEICHVLGGEKNMTGSSNTKNNLGKKEAKTLKLVAVDRPDGAEIIVNSERFVIGKNPHMVDGVISFNKAISRKHCMIVLEEDSYSIIDLESSNYTYVNKKRLAPNVPCQLKDGDIVRLADSNFQVQIG